MSNFKKRLIKLCQSLESKGLEKHTPELKKIVDEKDDSERPLYEATPTDIPGTWTKSSGELIKTSKD